VSDVVILLKPRFFRAVAQVYENWYDVPDHEVLAAVNQWQKESQP
jgi:predicted phosphoribosyltransferase